MNSLKKRIYTIISSKYQAEQECYSDARMFEGIDMASIQAELLNYDLTPSDIEILDVLNALLSEKQICEIGFSSRPSYTISTK